MRFTCTAIFYAGLGLGTMWAVPQARAAGASGGVAPGGGADEKPKPAESGAETEEMKQAMARKVSFKLADVSLSDAVAFLGNVIQGSGAKIEMDAGADRNVPVSLRVSDMRLGLALEWVAKLADCKLVKSGGTIRFSRQ